jgi:hypothetical protein
MERAVVIALFGTSFFRRSLEFTTHLALDFRHFTASNRSSCHHQQESEEYLELSMLYICVLESLEPLRKKLAHLHKTQESIRARQSTRTMIPLTLREVLAAADKRSRELEREVLRHVRLLRQLAKKMSDVGRF